VSLGIDYGIAPGQFGRPSEATAIALLRRARDSDVTLYDTAPAYGDSERLVGAALGDDLGAILATKITVPRAGDGSVLRGDALAAAVHASLSHSRTQLRRQRLDLVQIHNATVDLIEDGELLTLLASARERGELAAVGASVYREDEALAAVGSRRVQVIQVAYNVLDQRMAARVFAEAARHGVGVLVRSAFLKGALTEKAALLPPSMAPLRDAAERARAAFGVDWAELSKMSLRFCLSDPRIASVLVGVANDAELQAALEAAHEGPLPPELLTAARSVAIDDDRWLNPSRWPPL
jgi:aryl-alcohol dehydrogenase-like predicted oxidoreductase